MTYSWFQLKRKGAFKGTLVIQTFASHYTATLGAERIPTLGDPPQPSIALSLSAAAVSILMLY